MQSGPYGHSIQYILEDNEVGSSFDHEDLAGAGSRMYHQHLRANTSYAGVPFKVQTLCGDRWDRVTSIIAGGGRLGRLISGSIDLDNIDNVIRLAFHMGICDRNDGTMAIEIARNIEPSSAGLITSVDILPLIVRWQEIRKHLYEFLLLDWAEFSAKAMLTRAFEEAVRLEMVGVDSWRMTDDELIQYFLTRSVGEAQYVKELTRRLRVGELFFPVLMSRSPSVDLYRTLTRIDTKREIERGVRKAAFEDRSGPQLLVHFILDVRKTQRSVQVKLRETGTLETLGSDSRSLLIGVFSSTPVGPKEYATLQTEALRILSEHGCQALELIPDPLGKPPAKDRQLGLFP
jgi:HD superfamily phosphohydrolase